MSGRYQELFRQSLERAKVSGDLTFGGGGPNVGIIRFERPDIVNAYSEFVRMQLPERQPLLEVVARTQFFAELPEIGPLLLALVKTREVHSFTVLEKSSGNFHKIVHYIEFPGRKKTSEVSAILQHVTDLNPWTVQSYMVLGNQTVMDMGTQVETTGLFASIVHNN